MGRSAGGRAGGAVAAILTMLAGPPDAVRHLVESGRVDWFQAGRVIPDTVTEFPWFSLLWGDLNAYFMALMAPGAGSCFGAKSS